MIVDTWYTAKRNIAVRSKAKTVLYSFPAAKTFFGKCFHVLFDLYSRWFMLYSNVWEHGRDAKEERLNFSVGNVQTNSCSMQWPWTIGISLWWKMNTFTRALHQQVWGYNPTIPESLPDIRIMLFCFKPYSNVLATLFPKLAEATFNRGWKITFFQASSNH